MAPTELTNVIGDTANDPSYAAITPLNQSLYNSIIS
jgi:hypothetical protein